jgi:biotin carboxyl carrier protein
MNKLTVTVDGKSYEVEISPSRTTAGEYGVTIDGEPFSVFVPDYDYPDNIDWMIVDNRPYEMVFGPDLRSVQLEGGRHDIFVRDRETHTVRPPTGDGRVKAPIPGLINRISVEAGQTVEASQSLLVLEAMKMENDIRAPRAGTVRLVNVKPGQSVTLNEVLVEIE